VKVPKTKKAERMPIEPLEAWKAFILNADKCSKREVTGNSAIELMQETFRQSSEAQEKWMRKVLKKNLAIGISTKTLNKVQSNFIPTFNVALAQKFDMKRIQGDEVYVEPKLDGIRCLAIVENGEAKLFTRAGKLITNFDETVGKELRLMDDGCYDGEIMSNDFTDLMRQVYRKENKDIADVYLSLFDYIPLSEWRAGKSQTSCRERYEILED
jgi:DNA ligase-1